MSFCSMNQPPIIFLAGFAQPRGLNEDATMARWGKSTPNDLIICVRRTQNSTICVFTEKHVHSIFVQLGFNLSNGVTGTLDSSSKLIYLETRKSIYTRKSG